MLKLRRSHVQSGQCVAKEVAMEAGTCDMFSAITKLAAIASLFPPRAVSSYPTSMNLAHQQQQ